MKILYVLVFIFSCKNVFALQNHTSLNLIIEKADSHRILLNFSDALSLYLKALNQAQEERHYKTQTECMVNISDLKFVCGDYKGAEQYAMKSKSLVDSFKLDIELRAKVDQQIGKVLMRNLDSNAVGYLYRALEFYQNCSTGLETANTLRLIGSYYTQTVNFDSAKNYLDKSLNILNNHTNADQHLATTYHDLGYYHFQSGDEEKMFSYYDKAMKLRKGLYEHPHPDLAGSFSDFAYYYYFKGDYIKSLNYFKQASFILKQIFGLTHPKLAENWMNMGFCYFQLEQYKKAIQYHHRAQNIWDTYYDGIHPFYPMLLRGQARCFEMQGKIIKAHHLFISALSKHIQLFGKHHLKTSYSYRSLGDFHFRNGWYDSAQFYFLKTFEIHNKEYEQNVTLSGIYLRLANTELKLKVWDKSLKNYQEALKCISYGFSPTTLYDNPTLPQIKLSNRALELLSSKAEAYKTYFGESNSIFHLKVALNTYKLYTKLVDKSRYTYSNDGIIQLNRSTAAIFEQAIEACYLLFQQTKDKIYLHQAFQFAEQSKAFMLLQDINDAHAKSIGKVPRELINSELELKKEIAHHKKAYYESINDSLGSKKEEIHKKLFRAEEKLALHIKKIEQKYPKYYELKYRKQFADIQLIQNFIHDDIAVLEYFVGKSNIYLFYISKKTFTLFKLDQADSIKKSANQLVSYINQEPFSSSYRKDIQWFANISYQLYRNLIPKEISKEMIIIPDGELMKLPFEVLTEQPNSADKFSELPYLLYKSDFSYAYSSTLLFASNNNKKSTQYSDECIAFAPSYSQKTKNSQFISRGSLSTLRDQDLIELPGVQLEVQAIAQYFSGEFLFGDQANELNFKKLAPNYRIVHIASHADAHENPLLSKMNLSKTNKDDGKLYAHEIYNTLIPAELVVLSACETGKGKLIRGEGVMSIARSFIQAGSQSVVQTLWKTDDLASVDIMRAFYSNLSQRMNKDRALANAKRQFIRSNHERKSHPYYWASFTFIGDAKPISKNEDNAWVWIITTIVLLLLLGIIYSHRQLPPAINSSFKLVFKKKFLISSSD